MDIIQEINRSYGLSEDGAGQSNDDPVVVLRGVVERACERLSEDLYNSRSHFILEFIQNADDNDYDPTVFPTLRLHLSDHKMIIRCNEKGFNAANVRAICNIGRSTKSRKKRAEGYIGEKGIGFKAVFVVAQQVHVASREYTFRFDRDGPLGMINPIWDASHPSDPGWTTFRLGLDHVVNQDDPEDQIKGIHPTLLLFLRKLRSIDIEVASDTVSLRRSDEPDQVTRLERYKNGTCVSTQRYIVFKRAVNTYTGEEKRRDIEQSEVVLAFPVDDSGRPVAIEQQHDVHAFLPVNKYGLPFVVQADFLTSASREDITDSQWNRVLLDGVRDTFLAAVERLQQHHILRDYWVRYVPMRARDPFRKVQDGIVAALRKERILRDSLSRQQLPTNLIQIPGHFKGRSGEPLIDADDLLPSTSYICDQYDADKDWEYLSKLGVTRMSDEQFLNGLRIMDRRGKFARCSEEWHETVSQYLLRSVPRIHGCFHWNILDLRILPLFDGTWERAKPPMVSNCFFLTDSELSADVGLKFIASTVRPGTLRYAFFKALGVREADAAIVAMKILESNKAYTLHELVRFAHFFYRHRDTVGFPDPSNLHVMDEQERVTTGAELYVDMSTDGSQLRTILPHSPFIHNAYIAPPSGYEASSWLTWLHDWLGVHDHPRIVCGGLSPEFREMVETLSAEPGRLLCVLREHWPFISEELSDGGKLELSQVTVTCADGVRRALAETALRTGPLKRLPPECLHFIDVDNPDDSGWDFLQELHVTVEPNAAAWLRVLEHLQRTNAQDSGEVVTEAYKQLDARFDEAPGLIRHVFRNGRLLLLISGSDENRNARWTEMSRAYWDGPVLFRDVQLMPTYPYLRSFFVDKLGMSAVPLCLVIDRILEISQEFEGKELQPDVKDLIDRTLSTLSSYILAMSPRNAEQYASELKRLQDKAIFPVLTTRRTIILRGTGDFYVVTKKIGKKLEGRVPLLATRVDDIRSLLDRPEWSPAIKYLAPPLLHIHHELQGAITPYPLLRDRYNKPFLADCICSTIRHQLDEHARQEESYALRSAAKLHALDVRIADEIVETVSLPDEGVSEQSTLALVLDETDQALIIHVARGSLEIADDEIAQEFSWLFGIDLCRMMMYMDSSPQRIRSILSREGIELLGSDYPIEDTYAYDQDLSASHNAVVVRPACNDVTTSDLELTPSSSTLTFSYQSISVSKQPPFSAIDPPQHRSLADQIDEEVSALEGKLQDLTFNPERVHKIRSLDDAPSKVEVSSLVTWHSKPHPDALSTVPADALATITQVVTHQVSTMAATAGSAGSELRGILGEYIAFRWLSETLGPGFGPENWTSERRGLVPGFTHYEGSSIANFRCPDDNGALTALWYGEDAKSRWEPAWPTYHIEVKSTLHRGMFYMTRQQLRTALSLTTRPKDSDSPPSEVYVVVCISGIHGARPEHEVFIDPYRLIYEGQLVIASGDTLLVSAS